MYEVQFPDGHIEEYTAKVIAENIYSQVDANGNHHLIYSMEQIKLYEKQHKDGTYKSYGMMEQLHGKLYEI